MYVFNNIKYELEKNEKDGFIYDEVLIKFTDYFEKYDYVFGDWAYGKLRLKGFYASNNKKVKNLNDIKNLENYIENNCAFACKYFLLKKIRSVVE